MPDATNTTYPGELDRLPAIGPNDKEDAAGLEHDVMHDRAHALLNAIQELLGESTAPEAGSILNRLALLEAGGGGGGGGAGALTKLGEVVVAAPTTDIDFTGVDLDAGKVHLLTLAHVPNAAGGQTVRLYYNGDTANSSYARTYVGSDGGGPFGGGGVEAEIMSSGIAAGPYPSLAEVLISKSPGHRVHAMSRFSRYAGTGSFGMINIAHERHASTANVTSIKLRTSAANGFGVGTRARLYTLS